MSKILINSQKFGKSFQSQTNDKEQGFDVLLNKDIINDPPKIINRRDIYFITVSKNLCDKIKNKKILTQDDVLIAQNTGDGNFFYKALSQFYHNTEEYHIYY
jgi:hypothetical protein